MGDKARLDDDCADGGVGKDAGVFGRGKAPVERQQDGSDPGAGKQQYQICRMVEAEIGDHLARTHAKLQLAARWQDGCPPPAPHS